MFSSFNSLNNLIPTVVLKVINTSTYSIVVSPKHLLLLLQFLKLNVGYQYNLLSCISGVDLLKYSHRFMVVYELLSLTYNSRLRLYLYISEYSAIPSSYNIFINSNWWEREIWDLFGIFFLNHPDLRRLLTDYGFEGYPLRKDFPLSGFTEVSYDFNKKNISYDLVVLTQEYRAFTFDSPWHE